ncbi:hypothetical protein [Streptomyces mangrovisoli]|uniref:Pentapeptide repeat-containing protein n=1 Tax=Streptomyces mangrovisoli TaxID=1428628 RepID=A0A1J4NMP8_9ACTN|nr:hypothetical protein [Streptomyces mangrovisoli]OIJ63571.1 hypothetical protein WN71_032605 [Streptomyces mangrovisoli]
MLLQKQEIVGVKSVGSGRVLGAVELDRCLFNGAVLAQFDDPGLGLVVRDVTARRCRATRCVVQGVRFEDVRVDGLAITSLLHLHGCVFKHVTLAGNIGPLMATPPNFGLPQDLQDRFTAGMVSYYADVDWALDISRAAVAPTRSRHFATYKAELEVLRSEGLAD